ncbi:MAG: hypothetical protein DRG33_02655 [Deltaproteobacteria bacterium]|nr:MAG: hypothetical protein DRG33_02655 [Deltaproteobacteria bacterium]
MTWLIVLWSQGSIDMVRIDKIASIRAYNAHNRLSVNINTIDRLRITFDFYDKNEFFKLPAVIKHAERYNFDVIVDLRNQKIFEAKKGVILVGEKEKED